MNALDASCWWHVREVQWSSQCSLHRRSPPTTIRSQLSRQSSTPRPLSPRTRHSSLEASRPACSRCAAHTRTRSDCIESGRLTALVWRGMQLSHASVDYMAVYHDTTLHTRDVIDESLANGRSFIQKCILLDHRMAGVELLATQLSEIDRALIALEVAFRRVPE